MVSGARGSPGSPTELHLGWDFVFLLLVQMLVVGEDAHGGDQSQGGGKPPRCARVPDPVAPHGGCGRLHRSQGQGRGQQQFCIPGHQVEMALSTHLSPYGKDSHPRDGELHGISDAEIAGFHELRSIAKIRHFRMA